MTSPTPGTGATAHYPQDRYPYVITRVSETGNTFWMTPLAEVDTSTGHEPSHFDGPFPVWRHTYTPSELLSMRQEDAREIRVTLTARGWTHGGVPVTVGKAHYYRNYSY
ncbi:hypothetical protein ACWDR7_03385 [Microbacterium sp. NPDC003461]